MLNDISFLKLLIVVIPFNIFYYILSKYFNYNLQILSKIYLVLFFIMYEAWNIWNLATLSLVLFNFVIFIY
jgi:hypothetical protein